MRRIKLRNLVRINMRWLLVADWCRCGIGITKMQRVYCKLYTINMEELCNTHKSLNLILHYNNDEGG